MSDETMRLVPENVLERLDDMMCNCKADGSVLLSESVANEHGEDLQALLNAYHALATPSTRDDASVLSATDLACYEYPGEGQAKERAAFVAGAMTSTRDEVWPVAGETRSPDAPCACFGDSGLQASTHHDTDDNERCDLCGGLVAEAVPVEPVGVTGEMPGSNGGFSMAVFKSSDVPVGTPLYATPPAPQGDALRIAVEEVADAVDFFDRVKASTQAEQIAVGRDHWNRLDAAARALAALKSEGK